MGIHELTNEEKARARVGRHILSERGKGKAIKLSSEILIALEESKQV